MLKYILVAMLAAVGCIGEEGGDVAPDTHASAEAAGSAAPTPVVAPSAVGVDTEAVCGSPGTKYTAITSNHGAPVNESSTKARALRVILMGSICNASNNTYTCVSDSCTSNTGVQPLRAKLTDCTDLPTCAGFSCRWCNFKVSTSTTGAFQTVGRLEYRQGYEQAHIDNGSDWSVQLHLEAPVYANVL